MSTKADDKRPPHRPAGPPEAKRIHRYPMYLNNAELREVQRLSSSRQEEISTMARKALLAMARSGGRPTE